MFENLSDRLERSFKILKGEGKITEINVAETMKELGIPTPFNAYTYHIIKSLEEKNDGLFDYTGKNEESICAN